MTQRVSLRLEAIVTNMLVVQIHCIGNIFENRILDGTATSRLPQPTHEGKHGALVDASQSRLVSTFLPQLWDLRVYS